MFRVVVFLVFMLFLVTGHPSLATAQERVRVGWAAMTASHTPLWVAQEKGFSAKQGLSVESIFFGAGPPAMQALVVLPHNRHNALKAMIGSEASFQDHEQQDVAI